VTKIPDIVASLDAEWVNARNADVSMPATDNRLLSYQLTIMNRITGKTWSVIIEPKDGSKRGRLGLGNLLGRALRRALQAGVIAEYPDKITLVAHFARADLTHLRDWKVIGCCVDAVRRTFTSASRPFTHVVPTPRGPKRISIMLTDTMLLAPAKMKSLERLGAALRLTKVALPPGYSKDCMDLFKQGAPEAFADYAIMDTIIAARWAVRVWGLLLTAFGVADHVPTLGSAAVRMIADLMTRAGLSVDAYFGYERIRRARQPLACLTEVWAFSANTYHGGRNEAFHLGHTPPGTDAFTISTSPLHIQRRWLSCGPDWLTARHTTDLHELALVEAALTYARVRFEFLLDIQAPCLPVRAGDRGLIYPRTGTSWCTGPELVGARDMGATIQVEAGWRINWISDSVRPFGLFTRKINEIRADAKAVGDVIRDELAKEVGNSAYGKTAQAVEIFRTIVDGGIYSQRGKRVFNTRTGEMQTLPPSRITCPMLAAYTTGLVRAMLSEALGRLPVGTVVATATTDGFLSSAPLAGFDVTGPVATVFAAARARITPGKGAVWEEKHRVAGVLVPKTRGTISTRLYQGLSRGAPVLARAGFRLERRHDDPWAECRDWVQLHRSRTYGTRLNSTTLTDLRTQWIADADLVEVSRSVKLNLDFDMKRRIIDPVDVGGVITARTDPWENVEAFHGARDALERWKKAQRRVLKTTQDFLDLQGWIATQPGLKVSGSTAQSVRPALVNMIIRAAARGELGLAGWPNRWWAAFITACGWAVTEQTIKDARRRGKITLGQLNVLDPSELDFAEALLAHRPDASIEALAQPGSPAAIAVAMLREFVSAFDFHRPDLPELGEGGLWEGAEVALAGPPYSASATSGNRYDPNEPSKPQGSAKGGACPDPPI
jgi:hypothetical protein